MNTNQSFRSWWACEETESSRTWYIPTHRYWRYGQVFYFYNAVSIYFRTNSYNLAYKAVIFLNKYLADFNIFRNSRACVWSPPKSKRFVVDKFSNLEGPEPATYHPSDMDSINGSYIVSKFKNGGTRKFMAPKPDSMARAIFRTGK